MTEEVLPDETAFVPPAADSGHRERRDADRGVSLDAQRAKATAYAQLYELDLLEVISS